MAESDKKHPTPASLAVDAALIAFFAFIIYRLVSPHVPSNDPKWIAIWGGACTACMTGVFWLCVQMFRVVLRNQREAGRK